MCLSKRSRTSQEAPSWDDKRQNPNPLAADRIRKSPPPACDQRSHLACSSNPQRIGRSRFAFHQESHKHRADDLRYISTRTGVRTSANLVALGRLLLVGVHGGPPLHLTAPASDSWRGRSGGGSSSPLLCFPHFTLSLLSPFFRSHSHTLPPR